MVKFNKKIKIENIMEGKKNYNIILVNLDGMRRDKVDFCPSLDKLKKQSYFFPLMDTV